MTWLVGLSEEINPTPPYLIETLPHEIIAKAGSGNLIGAGSAVARERIGDLIVALQALGLQRYAIVEIIRWTVEQIERHDGEDTLIPLEWHETTRYAGAPPMRLGEQIVIARKIRRTISAVNFYQVRENVTSVLDRSTAWSAQRVDLGEESRYGRLQAECVSAKRRYTPANMEERSVSP
jgi:hypothetical protein